MNPSIQPDSPLVLVVDDDRVLRSLLRLAMEEEGYQVAEAKNGENCLSEFARLQPDIVLLDAVMPVMDGFACCDRLRATAKHTPILMITVLDDGDSVDRAFAVGATDYVTKPIHWAVLRQRVTRLLEATRSLKQVQQIAATLQQQSQREQLFRGIARRLSQSQTLAEILNPSLREIREFLAVDYLRLRQSDGNLTVESTADDRLSASDWCWEIVSAEALEAGKVIAIADIQQAERFAALELPNIKAMLVVPILIQGEWRGVLEAAHSHTRDWDAETIDLLVELGNLLAIAIERFPWEDEGVRG